MRRQLFIMKKIFAWMCFSFFIIFEFLVVAFIVGLDPMIGG